MIFAQLPSPTDYTAFLVMVRESTGQIIDILLSNWVLSALLIIGIISFSVDLHNKDKDKKK